MKLMAPRHSFKAPEHAAVASSPLGQGAAGPGGLHGSEVAAEVVVAVSSPLGQGACMAVRSQQK